MRTAVLVFDYGATVLDIDWQNSKPGLPQLSRLAGMPTGGLPPLALAAVAEDLPTEALRSLDAEEAEYLIAALQRALNTISAAQAVLLETFATRLDEEAEQRGIRWGSGRGWDDAACALAPLLHVAPMTMAHRLDHARTLVRELPQTLSSAREGHLEPWRVNAIVSEAGWLRPGLGPVFDATLHAGADVRHLPAARLRARAAKTAVAVDPQSVQERAEQARHGRYVRVSPGEDPGMTRWNAYQPAETSAPAWAAIDQLAHEYLLANPGRGIEAARGDAMLDLILQRASVRTTVTLAVPASAQDVHVGCAADAVGHSTLHDTSGTAADLHRLHECAGEDGEGSSQHFPIGSQEPASSRCTLVSAGRTGWLLADTVAALLTHPSTTVRLATLEPVCCTIRTLDQSGYRPKAALDRAVRERDGTCRFPGCAAPASRCDLDHVRPYPDGPTTAANLLTLCRRHHAFKHHSGWTLTMTPEGKATWMSPTGRTHTTLPRSVYDLVA